MKIRKIAVITGSRAEYGLLYWIIRGIHYDPKLQLQLIVTGMHLSPEFGSTVREIEKDGFPVADKVEMLLSSDTEAATSASMGLGMIGFAQAYERLRPDIILVLGDRFEILSAVAAAVPFRIPVAHIHGGESSEGVMDELFRHAITKMSHIHFTATEKYRGRVLRMGERPENVFCFGTPGIDNIYKLALINKRELAKALEFPVKGRTGIITFHPATLEKDSNEVQLLELLKALDCFPEVYWVFTLPNADTGGRAIIKIIEEYVVKNSERSHCFASLGSLKYLSLMKCADVLVGNSSSGLTEAPSFRLPVVNIGDRQRGRIRGRNIIDVQDCKMMRIKKAIDKALSDGFKKSLLDMENPYGKGNASRKIVNKLKSIPLGDKLLKKEFYEV